MLATEIHIVLHPQDVSLEKAKRIWQTYREMYEIFSEILPNWLMSEFNNFEAQTDFEETYATFVPSQLGLPAYVVLSTIVPRDQTVESVTNRIKKELDDTFSSFKVPYLISIQIMEQTQIFK
jgi:hypothetical protein